MSTNIRMILTDTLLVFTAIIMEAVDTYVKINKNTIFTEESATLTLTNEKLYYAFSFLNKNQVREVLWGQPQQSS